MAVDMGTPGAFFESNCHTLLHSLNHGDAQCPWDIDDLVEDIKALGLLVFLMVVPGEEQSSSLVGYLVFEKENFVLTRLYFARIRSFHLLG